jgi:urease accessory protein
VQSVSSPLTEADPYLPEVAVRVDRATLGRRSWQATADDGMPFSFELAAALRHGSTIFQTKNARYVISQQPEPLLAISLDLAPSAAAGIGWAIGNAHLELSAEPARMLTPDLPGTRALLERLQVRYTSVLEVFRSGRFSRAGQPASELGSGHRHGTASSNAQ